MTNRVLGRTPIFNMAILPRLKQTCKFMSRHIPSTVQEEVGKFALKYTGAKRARYLEATNHYHTYGITRRDAGITMFVKSERIDPVKVRPDPRAIQFRGSVYCVALASFLKPIEHHLYELVIPSVSPYRLVGKGLDQYQRAQVLRSKWERFKRPIAITLDARRFDKHVNPTLLEAEHSVYLRSNRNSFFRKLLSWQLKNFGRTADGLKYVTSGKRMSGDMNTALGNCIIMLLMLLTVLLPLNIIFDLMDDGDDCVLICESDDFDVVSRSIDEIINFGMVIKVENVTSVFEHIEWCQSRPILTALGWKFCRNPVKVLSTVLSGMKWKYLNSKGRLTYLRGLAECESVLNKGVPVLSVFADRLLQLSGSGKVAFDQVSGEYMRYIRELKCYRNVNELVPITNECRWSFENAFGISVAEQLYLERSFASWSFSVDGTFYDLPIRDNKFWVDFSTDLHAY